MKLQTLRLSNKKEKTKNTKIMDEREDITTDSTETKCIIWEYVNKWDSLDEMDKFWESQKPPNWLKKK